MVTIFKSWKELMSTLNTLDEEQLREAINLEVSLYKRPRFIERMHMRFDRLRSTRERKELVEGRTLL